MELKKKRNPVGTIVRYLFVALFAYLGILGMIEHFSENIEGALGGGILSFAIALLIFSLPRIFKKKGMKSDNFEFDQTQATMMAQHQIDDVMDDSDDYSD